MLNQERSRRRNHRTLCAEQLDARRLLAVMAFESAPDSDTPAFSETAFDKDLFQNVLTANEIARWDANTQNRIHGFEVSSFRFAESDSISIRQIERANIRASLKDIEVFIDVSSNLLSLDSPNPLEQADNFKTLPEVAAQKWSDDRLAGIALRAVGSVGEFSIASLGKWAFDGSQVMAGWALAQSSFEEGADTGSGFHFFANRTNEMSSGGTELAPVADALVEMGSPQGINLARIVSYLGQQLNFDGQSSARNTAHESTMAFDSKSGRGVDNSSPAHSTPVDSAVGRIINSLGRRRSLAPQEDAEGGLLEIGSIAKSAARSRAVAAIMQEDTLPELMPVEEHWIEFVQALFFNRSSPPASPSKDVREESARDKSTKQGRALQNEDAEGGMIELAPSGSDVPMIASEESQRVRRNRHEQSVRMDVGVAFFQEFELSTSPTLERGEIRIEEAGPREEPLKNPGVGQAKETVDLHSAAALVPLVLIGLTMSNPQDEKQSPPATCGRRRRDRSLAG